MEALKEATFTIEEAEHVAIMGPSGSGKTTLLNILGCLDRPTSGKYYLEEVEVSTLSDDELSEIRRKRLGFIFQAYNLIPQLTVVENIGIPLFYQGQSESVIREKSVEMAKLVGLGERLNHRPTQLSGGQQQRVAIARALVNDPAVILADEPTGNLDSITGREIMNLMKELNKQGKTLIVVTHDANVARYSKRVLRMLDSQVYEN
ncbi:MAG: ABC transporter ATP-binding protein [Candidatus Omnitrophica bacterium]|nr:ABC transporter ATP-binding protein [Candidatus Omnitrophota bacterium]